MISAKKTENSETTGTKVESQTYQLYLMKIIRTAKIIPARAVFTMADKTKPVPRDVVKKKVPNLKFM